MRKLFLITVIAIMSTSPCHANLSLASNDPSPAAIELPKLTTPEAGPAAVAKSPGVARPRRHVSHGASPFRGLSAPVRSFYHHCL